MNIKNQDTIKEAEGFSLVAYPDKRKGTPVWTIGWGTTRYYGGKSVTPGDTITTEEAQKLLNYDVASAEKAVNTYVKVPLSQNQFDALVSLTYNIGANRFKGSTLLRKLNRTDYIGASYQFSRWIYDDGVVVQGLINRRIKERDLFMKGFKVFNGKMIRK